MTNNDILRRLRYLFDYSDTKIIELFKLADCDVEEALLFDWFRKEDDIDLVEMTDREMATFLNGLIIEKRGKRDGPQPEPEDRLNNNLILKKLKIALDLKSDDIIDLFALTDKKISPHELSSFFRRPGHQSYRPFMDQYLRNFLNALQTKSKKEPGSI
ncbi:MAG: DUF1456 family protein [Candidatus Kapaibacterium sp.]